MHLSSACDQVKLISSGTSVSKRIWHIDGRRRGVSMDLRTVAFRASMAAAAAAPDSDDEAFDHQLAQPPALPSDAVGSGLHCGLDLHHWTPGNKSEQVRCLWPSQHCTDSFHT